MLASVRAFLAGMIDYAGLFPPAQLPLDQAIRNYARYCTEPESWLLGRFVCPGDLLADLVALGDRQLLPEDSLALAVVGDYPHVAFTDLRLRYSERFSITSERRGTPFSGPARSQYWPATFWEFEANSGMSASEFASLLAKTDPRHYGFKLRCGGPNASAFPSVEQVAHVITACRDAGVPLKFTAGLHHPLRHYNADVQTHLHGFLNVFGAGVLAHARKLSEEQVREIVTDEDAGHFVFTEDGFRWKEQFATVAEIAAARQQAVISFGSCSFDEPRDDLRKLGLL